MAVPTTPCVFVSHSHHDNDFGVRLVQDLRRAFGGDDNTVWYDVAGGLHGGDAWWSKIVKEISARPIFIVILSPDAMSSKWVNDEIDLAWYQKNSPESKHIIPVLYRDCQIRADLRTRHIIPFVSPSSYDSAFAELLIALGISPASAHRTATIPPSELASVDMMPATVLPTPSTTPVPIVRDSVDPLMQPISEAEVEHRAYPQATPASGASPLAQEPITHKPAMRNPALPIIGVVVVVVLLLSIIGAAVAFANRIGQKTVASSTPTPTATATTATATIPSGFSTFIDSNNVYKLNYPSSWTKQSTSSGYSLMMFSGTSASLAGVFEVEYFKTTIDPKTLQDQFFEGLGTNGKVVNKRGPTPTTLASESWQSETADVTNASSTQHVVVLTANHRQYSVVIAYLAAATAFENVNVQGFQPMLSSFQFLQ